MSSQSSDYRSRFLLTGLTAIQSGIKKLEEKKLAFEDLILRSLFGSPEGRPEHREAGEIELLEVLPSRHSLEDCAHYLSWSIRPEEMPGGEEYLKYADTEGHVIAARMETAVTHPTADVTVVIHPDLSKEEAVALLLKLGSVLERAGIHRGPATLHTGQKLEGIAPARQLEVAGAETARLETPRPMPIPVEQPAGRGLARLMDALVEFFAEADKRILARVDRAQAELRKEVVNLRGDVAHLLQLQEQVDRLARSVSEEKPAEQESLQQLAAAVQNLQHAESRRLGDVEALRDETRVTLTEQTRRQQDEFSAFRSSLEIILERLNRHAEVIRSLNEAQARHAAALRYISDALKQLEPQR